MAQFADKYNLVIGGIVTLLAMIFGAFWYIFMAYMALNIFDWLTGWYKARRIKRESSRVGIKGIFKKLGYWIIIAVAFLMSTVFVEMGKDVLHIQLDFLMGIGWFTLACLMVNEARSILENLVECGFHVPVVLVKGLAITEKLIKAEGKEDDKNGTQN